MTFAHPVRSFALAMIAGAALLGITSVPPALASAVLTHPTVHICVVNVKSHSCVAAAKAPAAGTLGAVLYQNSNSGGTQYDIYLPAGASGCRNGAVAYADNIAGYFNDQASSVWLPSPAGCSLTLYRDANEGGTSWQACPGTFSCNIPGWFNDQASSFLIY